MSSKAVLLDTSFFLRFLNDEDPLFTNADGYFRYFLNEDITMLISTISIAEYFVGGDIHELPLKNLQILPFNLNHAKRTGEFAKIVFQHKNKLKLNERILFQMILSFLPRRIFRNLSHIICLQTQKVIRFINFLQNIHIRLFNLSISIILTVKPLALFLFSIYIFS